jgi:hypothetical protein
MPECLIKYIELRWQNSEDRQAFYRLGFGELRGNKRISWKRRSHVSQCLIRIRADWKRPCMLILHYLDKKLAGPEGAPLSQLKEY